MDIVLDTMGGDNQLRSLETLKSGGIMVSTVPVGADGLQEKAAGLGVRAALILVEADRGAMQEIAQLVEDGSCGRPSQRPSPSHRPPVRMKWANTEHRTSGKLVLTMGDQSAQ